MKLRASVFHQGSDTSIFRPPMDNAGERQMKDRNLQLERRTAELEVIIEEGERETERLREEVARLEIEIQGEREKGMAGMSAEQLSRMRHINSFLEHNLRENGEMLASLGKLQEEKQEMKAMNWTLKERLADCVCSTTEERGKTLYGRYLRAEKHWCGKSAIWWFCSLERLEMGIMSRFSLSSDLSSCLSRASGGALSMLLLPSQG